MKTKLCIFVILLTCTCMAYGQRRDNPGKYGVNPYLDTDYKEPFRGQYHFSSQSGWMNDINGLIYVDGVYHMYYQHWPYSPRRENPIFEVFWGHAVSTDLIHWKNTFPAIDPWEHDGAAWSGSCVFDADNTSGFGTDGKAPVVILYTNVQKGTNVVYSLDGGYTYESYSGNPVLPGGSKNWRKDPRDPHVFWHESTKKWVMALFYKGTIFYTSPDLKKWTEVSKIKFGYECPDIFELPVDGDKDNTRWVLADAGGGYLIGDFDGTHYTRDKDNDQVYKMDVGPDWYAAQTFYKPTFPSERTVQIAWLSHWGVRVTNKVWSFEATFPVNLKLKTFPEGIRLTRTPIEEISTLYTSTNTWGKQTISPGNNLLSEMDTKAADITVVFNLEGSTATKFGLKIANQTITYNKNDQKLSTYVKKDDGTGIEENPNEKPLMPLDNKVMLRVLLDWGQMEIFSRDYNFSYSQQFPFDPADNSLELWANGDIEIESMEFHKMGRIWDEWPEAQGSRKR